MAILDAHSLSLVFGIVGNVIGFLVFLASIPTFYTIYKKKSSGGFQSIPYIIALSSAMLLLYYGLIKTDATMIISTNAVGCVIEMATLRLLFLFNAGYILILFVTMFLFKERQRIIIVGWICAVFIVAVFASPLSIMTKVIRTKSVEFMPITLSLFLTLCATTWFLYGLLVRDMFIAIPNVTGFFLGIAQMILYTIYKDVKTETDGAKEKQIDNLKLNPSHIKAGSHGNDHPCRKTSRSESVKLS